MSPKLKASWIWPPFRRNCGRSDKTARRQGSGESDEEGVVEMYCDKGRRRNGGGDGIAQMMKDGGWRHNDED
ncbi:hypothetical protein PIB30_050154 [Stylosanthes scabra]|uniref:Uncharacterized protein n=1 Tax=Stylosanthes scabra TaxID=79078 RepID=A0ABU6ZG97_9FABA|nr:hypothetical protein [Stylosanthes scabra]